MPDPTGVAVFPVTTFDQTGELDESRYRRHVSSTVQRAAFSCVIPLGSVGEFAYLTPEERRRIVELTIEETPPDVPVIPGTSAIASREAVAHSRAAEQVGADGVLVTPQSYFPPTEANVERYFRSVAEAIDIPVWAYNNPSTTGIDIDVELLSQLADIEGIDYIKSGTGDMRSFRQLARRVGASTPLFAAPPNMFEKLLFGARGWSGPVATIHPETATEVFQAAMEDDAQTVREVAARWQPLLDCFHEYPYVATMKAILDLQGRDVGDPRAPVGPLDRDRRRRVRQALDDLQLR